MRWALAVFAVCMIPVVIWLGDDGDKRSRGLVGVRGDPQIVAKQKMRDLAATIEVFRLRAGRLPESLDELLRDSRPPARYELERLEDPWGRRFTYRPIGATGVHLSSAGVDGEEGTSDDLVFTLE